LPLQPGDPAPELTATNRDGEAVPPAFVEPTVLYVYARDDTPARTLEAREFEADIDSFRRTGAAVYGLSTDDVDSHRAFADAEDLSFDLLADPDGAVAEAFDVEMQGDFDDRITFVLSDDAVQAVIDADTMQPEHHAAEVLEAVEAVAQ
jgi:peroxiredoxin Q/BCP